MPATLAKRPAPAVPAVSVPVFRTGVNVFGEVDGYNHPVRVMVPRTVHLSFAELLGGLAYHASLEWEEMSDDAAVWEAVRYVLVDVTDEQLRQDAAKAMAELGGCTYDREQARYLAHLAMVVSRVFGITAPSVVDASVSLVYVRTDIDVNGEADPDNAAPRIALYAPVWLSFADLLGLLALTPCMLITCEELADEAVLRLCLRMALTEATWDSIDTRAVQALAVLDGRGDDRDLVAFMRALGVAVTRVFGIGR